MKKLWINTMPGRDKHADEIFYFPQEVPKYLNGYYKVPKADAVKFGALLYRIQFGNDTQPLTQQTYSVLPQILPEDVMATTKLDEWRKLILSFYNSQVGRCDHFYGALGVWIDFRFAWLDMNEFEAKEEFLKMIQHYPNFGSTFFVVKQTTDANLPETILIAINRHGFNIIDPDRRVRICTTNIRNDETIQEINALLCRSR